MPSTATSRTVTGLTNGTSYLFRVAGVNHTVGDYAVSSAVTPTAPTPVITITTQPTNQTASSGAATFSVAATVTQGATLSYQWQRQEGGAGSFANVSGATSSLALTGLTNAADNGDVYRCVVSATGGAQSVTSSSATLTVAASGPLIGGGQILNSFALSGAPNPWGNVGDVNGTYVDEGSLSPASPGYGWVIDDGSSQYGGNLRITWWSDQGSCTCYDGNYNVLGTRQLGAGWVLWGGYSDMIAFAPGPNASIPPSTGWYKIYMAGGAAACSGPFGGDGSTPYGFSDCDPSIQPPTENWQPGFVTNLTFTPA